MSSCFFPFNVLPGSLRDLFLRNSFTSTHRFALSNPPAPLSTPFPIIYLISLVSCLVCFLFSSGIFEQEQMSVDTFKGKDYAGIAIEARRETLRNQLELITKQTTSAG